MAGAAGKMIRGVLRSRPGTVLLGLERCNGCGGFDTFHDIGTGPELRRRQAFTRIAPGKRRSREPEGPRSRRAGNSLELAS